MKTTVAAALVAAFLLTACTGGTTSPDQDTTTATAPAPVDASQGAGPGYLAADPVPKGMEDYEYDGFRLHVTLPDRDDHQTYTAVVDALADHPVSITATTSDTKTVITATWNEPATSKAVTAAKNDVTKAAPKAKQKTEKVTLVGVQLSAKVKNLDPVKVADLRNALILAVPGQYHVTDQDGTVTATWVADGLTTKGLGELTRIFAEELDLDTGDVKVSGLGD